MDSNKKTLFLWTIFMLISSNASSVTFSCDSCNDCQARIASASAGDSVLLTADINSTNECIYMNHTEGIVLDCQDHRTNSNGAYAITISFCSGIRVRNCYISNSSYGILVNHSNNISLMNNRVFSTVNYPIQLYDSNDSLISNNSVHSPRSAIFLAGSNRNTVTLNSVPWSGLSDLTGGLLIWSSNDNVVKSNVIGASMGIWISGSIGNSIISNRVCNHTLANYDILNEPGNSGSNNTCDLTKGYNDTGYAGCTHTCSGANGTTTTTTTTTSTTTTSTTTTTTSTSTTTSSTTTQIQCTLPGDYPPCGEIALQEVINEINKWATGTATLGEVIDLINSWAQG
jgi:parallel beta-helix repeat protein